ncbi:hypothetical protein V8D89_009942 [Ganoderma adspersum]
MSVEDVTVDPDVVGAQGPRTEVEQSHRGRVKIEQASGELFSGTLAEMRSLTGAMNDPRGMEATHENMNGDDQGHKLRPRTLDSITPPPPGGTAAIDPSWIRNSRILAFNIRMDTLCCHNVVVIYALKPVVFGRIYDSTNRSQNIPKVY